MCRLAFKPPTVNSFHELPNIHGLRPRLLVLVNNIDIFSDILITVTLNILQDHMHENTVVQTGEALIFRRLYF